MLILQKSQQTALKLANQKLVNQQAQNPQRKLVQLKLLQKLPLEPKVKLAKKQTLLFLV